MRLGWVGGIIVTGILLAQPLLFADEMQIPFAINTNKFLEEAKAVGLDLYGEDDSIGHVENKGTQFIVYTYGMMSSSDLDKLKEITWKSIRGRS